jgi:hypothetical protein
MSLSFIRIVAKSRPVQRTSPRVLNLRNSYKSERYVLVRDYLKSKGHGEGLILDLRHQLYSLRNSRTVGQDRFDAKRTMYMLCEGLGFTRKENTRNIRNYT